MNTHVHPEFIPDESNPHLHQIVDHPLSHQFHLLEHINIDGFSNIALDFFECFPHFEGHIFNLFRNLIHASVNVAFKPRSFKGNSP